MLGNTGTVSRNTPRAQCISPSTNICPPLSGTGRTQYHGQDGEGRYRFSYRQPSSTREEYVDENGRIQGSYSYEMPDGEAAEVDGSCDFRRQEDGGILLGAGE